MTVPRHNHKFDSQETKDMAERRIHELSGPGNRMTMTRYINALIRKDGQLHDKARKSNPNKKK